jgi:hypothetical protein
MRGSQRGVSFLFIAVALILVAGAALAIIALTRTKADVDRSGQTGASLVKVQAALEQFASTAERLPCPANPAIDTGDAEPNAASANCLYPAGTVPWRTIGLRREDSLDAWGWKIGYRVYSGAIGLTQAGGASMVQCDTVEPSPAGRDPVTGVCKTTRDTTEPQFLAGKGLSVNDFGTGMTDAAYVLISHGATGLGAYTTSSTQKTPTPTSTDEANNLLANGPFVAKAAVTNVAPESANHFDDVLAYRRLQDFVKRANLAARDWPEVAAPPPGFANLTFDSATVGAALGASASYGDTGQASIGFPQATISAFDSGGTQDISFANSGGTEGIGGVSGGTPMISSAQAEGVRIDLTQKAQQLAVTFFDFGRRPGNVREQVQFTFFDGAVPLAPVVLGQGCHNDGGLATFSIDAGALFDHVEIKSLAATNDGSASEFLFVQLLTCAAASTCTTSLSTPSNLC